MSRSGGGEMLASRYVINVAELLCLRRSRPGFAAFVRVRAGGLCRRSQLNLLGMFTRRWSTPSSAAARPVVWCRRGRAAPEENFGMSACKMVKVTAKNRRKTVKVAFSRDWRKMVKVSGRCKPNPHPMPYSLHCRNNKF